MLTILLAAALGGQPACQVATGYGAQYVATPYLSQAQQSYGASYAAPTYYNRVVTAFVPVYQVDQYRTEIVGDQARAAQYAQARLAADTELVNAIKGVTGTLTEFSAQVKQATQVQDQAFQSQRQPPPPVQYQAQPSPQSLAPPTKSAPPDYGQVPPPPVATPQQPTKGFPATPTVNVPPPPSDAAQDQQGTFPTQPQQPTGFQAPSPRGRDFAPTQPTGTLSPAMLAATAVIGTRCGSCHGPNGSGGVVLLSSKDRLASYDANFLKMLAQVAYRGYVLQPDGNKLKMPPNGRSLSQDEFAAILRAQDEADQAATLASNGQPGRQ